jgi:xanthine dehydrogenase YagS FAD-binding subunit
LRDTQGLAAVESEPDGWLRIGAMTRLRNLASQLHGLGLAGLTQSLEGLATPGIRRVATLGGSVFQDTRCSYYRGGFPCIRNGGEGCPAENADTHHFSLIETKGCVAVHPSTSAMALLAYRAVVVWSNGVEQPLAQALTRRKGDACIALRIPPSLESRGRWRRISSRIHSEWPLVEGVCTAGEGFVRVALGGVAPQPLFFEADSADNLRKRVGSMLKDSGIREVVSYKSRLVDAMLDDLLEEL